MKDMSPKVEITINLTFENCEYPEPTRETIYERLSELLIKQALPYSEKRHPQSNFEIVNEKPISSDLETFGDIDSISEQSKHLGRPSKEQGGSRVHIDYNTDNDPFNE